MVEAEAELFFKVSDTADRVFIVVEQCLAVVDGGAEVRVAVAFGPVGDEGFEFFILGGVLVVEGVEVVIFFGAGDEIGECGLAVVGEDELFDEADFVGGGGEAA